TARDRHRALLPVHLLRRRPDERQRRTGLGRPSAAIRGGKSEGGSQRLGLEAGAQPGRSTGDAEPCEESALRRLEVDRRRRLAVPPGRTEGTGQREEFGAET